MSPDEDALLNGIAADPAADLPRLVYADWLEEHGQDLRAEFIRVQCEIAKLEVGPRDVIDRNVHLWRRQQQLLDGYLDAILDGLPLAGKSPRKSARFRRGFLDETTLLLDDYRQQADALASIRPMPSEVTMQTEDDFVESRDSASVAAHSLVTSMLFFGRGNPGGIVHFDQGTVWPRLKSLSSSGHAVVFAELLVLLTRCVPALTSLNLADNQLNDNDVIDLLNAGILQRLSHISLIENAIGDQAAIELADRLGNSKNLKELDLRRNGITSVGQAELLARLGSKVILF